MSDKLPIDYARAESADVVRKKFRRRVVMFGIATVVVMGIGAAWLFSMRGMTFLIGDQTPTSATSIVSYQGWISWHGPPRYARANEYLTNGEKCFESTIVGFNFCWFDVQAYPKWQVGLRYRTLFILAMIPWIITLIRMIRMWKRKKVLSAES